MPDNAGDDWGDDKSSMMTTTEAATIIISTIQTPGTIQTGIIEFKKTNWNL